MEYFVNTKISMWTMQYSIKLIKIYIRTRILKQCVNWQVSKHNLESYYLSGSRFYWAPTFELELAKLVEPEEE